MSEFCFTNCITVRSWIQLTIFHVGGNSVNDDCIAILVQSCPNLTDLNVATSDGGITNVGINYIANGLSKLKKINIWSRGMQNAILSKCQQLKDIFSYFDNRDNMTETISIQSTEVTVLMLLLDIAN